MDGREIFGGERKEERAKGEIERKGEMEKNVYNLLLFCLVGTCTMALFIIHRPAVTYLHGNSFDSHIIFSN